MCLRAAREGSDAGRDVRTVVVRLRTIELRCAARSGEDTRSPISGATGQNGPRDEEHGHTREDVVVYA